MSLQNARKVSNSTDAPRDARTAIRWAAAALAGAGIDSPRLCTELLLAHVLGCDRLHLTIDPALLLSPDRDSSFRHLVQRRLAREPVQHLIGFTEFWSLPIRCDRRALIPRPETELLVELALELARGIASPLIADIGTGTGCIAIAMACELPQARIIATDISADALALAGENIRMKEGREEARWDSALHQTAIINHQSSMINISLRRGDLLAPLAQDGPGAFDLILSNPPYIPDADMATLQPEVRDHDPELALRGGPEGCTIISRLLREARLPLRPGGFLVMEIGIGEAEFVKQNASAGWKLLRTVRDGAGIERVVALQKER